MMNLNALKIDPEFQGKISSTVRWRPNAHSSAS